MVVLLGHQERLGGIASGWGWMLEGLALRGDALLGFLLVLAERGVRVTNERRVRNVRAGVGRGA